jgi:predicted GNAT family N-acyltransferase
MECELRNEVLRLPLGLNLFEEDLSQEAHQLHFGLFDQVQNLIACVIAVKYSATEAKIRQMAVKSAYAGQGVGRTLIQSLEDYLARRGITRLSMHARVSAVGFYEKLGYERVGHEFVEVCIPHTRMQKQIQLTE